MRLHDPSHNSRVPDLYAWWEDTNRGDLRLIWHMPEKAQREISASVVSLAAWEFERRVGGSAHEDAGRRLANWRSVCDPNAGRWVTAVPWDRHGHMNVNNTAYRVSFARRYRLQRPAGLRGRGGPAHMFDGDYDECGNPQRQWTKTLVHNTLVDAVMRFCKDCGMVDVQSEVKYWDPVRIGTECFRMRPGGQDSQAACGKKWQ